MMRKRNEFSREETLELERKEKEAKEEERKRQHENESTNKEFNYSNSIMNFNLHFLRCTILTNKLNQ